MSVFHGVKCDGCGGEGQLHVGADRPPLHDIREMLKKRGWLVLQLGGKDYCPVCVNRLRLKVAQ